MILSDASNKTTRYVLPLLFFTVKTNIGYPVVAIFVIENENTEQISETLNVIK